MFVMMRIYVIMENSKLRDEVHICVISVIGEFAYLGMQVEKNEDFHSTVEALCAFSCVYIPLLHSSLLGG